MESVSPGALPQGVLLRLPVRRTGSLKHLPTPGVCFRDKNPTTVWTISIDPLPSTNDRNRTEVSQTVHDYVAISFTHPSFFRDVTWYRAAIPECVVNRKGLTGSQLKTQSCLCWHSFVSPQWQIATNDLIKKLGIPWVSLIGNILKHASVWASHGITGQPLHVLLHELGYN